MMVLRKFMAARLVSAGVALGWIASSAHAVTETWNGMGMANSMNVGADWLDTTTPVSGDPNLTLVFNAGTTTNLTQNIASPLVVQSLQFNGGVGHQFSGSQFQLQNLGGAPTIELTNGASPHFFTTPLAFAAPTTIKTLGTGSSLFTVSAAMTGTSLTFDGQSTGFLFAQLQGPGNTLTGAHVITGRAQVSIGTGGQAFGGSVTVNGSNASLVGNGNNNQFAAGTDLSLINGGVLNMNGASQTVDQLVLESGGAVITNGGETLAITGPLKSNVGSGAIGQFINNFTHVDFSGQFKNVDITSTGPGDAVIIRNRIFNGSIDKTGAGVLEVPNSANSYTGTNVVNAGTLRGGPQSVGTVLNNDTVEFNAGGTLVGGQITGTGQVNISSAGVTYGGAQSYAGGTFLNGGQAIGDTTTLLGSFTGLLGGNIAFNQNTSALWSGNLSGSASLSHFGPAVLSLGGSNPYTGGTFVGNGGLEIQTNTAIGTGPLQVFGGSLRATGSRTLANQLTLAQMSFDGSGDFDFTDTATKVAQISTTHNSSGTTKIAGIWQNGAATLTVNAGQLTIGNPAVVNGFTSSGPVIVNGGTLTVRSLNFISLPSVTLAGGTLNAPNGYAIPLGAVLQGAGGVSGRVASANGSTIIASGNMSIGDGSHLAGVNLDGELYTNDFSVTLNDANQAVLGSFTNLGFSIPGTLNAPKGLVLNFGRNLTGWGNVNSNNTLANAVIANGDVQGDSFTNFLDFSGYVKGVGTFNNVAFSGTFSPGLSPAVVDVGNAILQEGSVLEMELGGVNRGGQYDGLNVSGQLALNGTLKVSLLNGFAPGAGMQFNLFDGVTTGSFDNYALPALAAGLSWDASQLTTNGVLAVVVGGIPGDYNGDGSVDAADYSTYRDALASGSALANDNTPGSVSLADYNVWKSNFGLSAASWVAVSAAVPEPCSLLLVACGILAGYSQLPPRGRRQR